MCIAVDVHKQLVTQGDSSLQETSKELDDSGFGAVFNNTIRVDYEPDAEEGWV